MKGAYLINVLQTSMKRGSIDLTFTHIDVAAARLQQRSGGFAVAAKAHAAQDERFACSNSPIAQFTCKQVFW